MRKKTKIVLDADVIIHFLKGELFPILPNIFPAYQLVILDVVYNEICKNTRTKSAVDNYLHYFKKISLLPFKPEGESNKEYFRLSVKMGLGRGESACMVFCRDNLDALGSSNLKDIATYCETHGITYLTTLDFLYHAYTKKIISEAECNAFIKQVISLNSTLPNINIAEYCCKVTL